MVIGAAWVGMIVGACSTSAPIPSLDGRLVDEEAPVFSNPTEISNPLFPATADQIVQLGVDGGQPLRVEITLMPETRTVEWDGRSIETVVSQFISYREGRILEVAYDFFAQADDGSVWYLGEDVDNFREGTVSDHHGAWLAGEDGPGGMIMPAEPQVGDIYHPENIPGVVFEEVIVLETDVSADGPTGKINGAIRVREHLIEGNAEEKIFAPGYGEFEIDAGNEHVVVAVAVPTDALSNPLPPEFVNISSDAASAFDAATSEDWSSAADRLEVVRDAWRAIEADVTSPGLREQMSTGLEVLAAAIDARDQIRTRRAAVDVGLASLDAALQYVDPSSVDLSRMAFWARRVISDSGDGGAMRGGVAILETIWARARHVTASVDADEVESQLSALRAAAEEENRAEATRVADELIGRLERMVIPE